MTGIGWQWGADQGQAQTARAGQSAMLFHAGPFSLLLHDHRGLLLVQPANKPVDAHHPTLVNDRRLAPDRRNLVKATMPSLPGQRSTIIKASGPCTTLPTRYVPDRHIYACASLLLSMA